jgi:hypothetical protein
MGRSDRIVFLALAGAAYVYVIARAIMVPVILDEAGAFHMFVLTGDFVPFVAKWDAGNHLVYSALEQVSYFLFGESLIGLRIWSVFGFALYAWYLWRCGPWFRSAVVRWCAWAALLCVPFMVEFFSLARGYGLAMGFWAMTLHHLVRSVTRPTRKDLIAVLVGTILTTWTLLSTLMICGGVIAIVGLMALRDRWPLGRGWTIVSVAGLGILPWSVMVAFALDLSAHGALYAGSSGGYTDGTIASLGGQLLGLREAPWTMILTVLVAALAGLLMAHSKDGAPAGQRIPLALLTGLLVFDALALSLSHALLGSNLPTDRVALYVVQPAVMVVALGIDAIGAKWAWCRVLAAALLFLPYREASWANVDHTSYWAEQAAPASFYRLVEEHQRTKDRPLLVGGYVFLAKSTWPFGARVHGSGLVALDAEGFPQPTCDLLMIDSTAFDPPPGFRVIARAKSGHNNLMERIEPLRTHLMVDSVFSLPMSDDEFRFLWEVAARPWKGRSLLLGLDARITSPRGTIDTDLTISVKDSAAAHIFHNRIAVDHYRGSTTDGWARLVMRIPLVPDSAATIGFSLHNQRRRWYALDSVRVRVYTIDG